MRFARPWRFRPEQQVLGTDALRRSVFGTPQFAPPSVPRAVALRSSGIGIRARHPPWTEGPGPRLPPCRPYPGPRLPGTAARMQPPTCFPQAFASQCAHLQSVSENIPKPPPHFETHSLDWGYPVSCAPASLLLALARRGPPLAACAPCSRRSQAATPSAGIHQARLLRQLPGAALLRRPARPGVRRPVPAPADSATHPVAAALLCCRGRTP